MITEEEEIDEIGDLNNETEKIISHAESMSVLDITLLYIKQQPDALPHDVLFLKILRDNAKRFSIQKQTTLE